MERSKYIPFIIVMIISFTGDIFCQKEAEVENQYKTWFWKSSLTPEEYMHEFRYVQDNIPEFSHKPGTDAMQSVGKWYPAGPVHVKNPNNSKIVYHGRIRCTKWHYTQEDGWELYLGSSSGGLWYGNTVLLIRNWQQIGENLPNPSVSAIEMRNNNKDMIFVGTGDWGRFSGAGLFRTTDRGKTWNNIPLHDENGNEVIPDAITDLFYVPGTVMKDMYLSSTSGFFKSTDGGTSWRRKEIKPGSPGQAIFDMVSHPTDGQIVYTALPKNGIYKSTDGGENWIKCSIGMVLHSENSGSTLALAISKSKPDKLYAAVPNKDNSGAGIYKSTNAGGSWQYMSSPQYMYNGQGFHTNVISVDPENSNIVYAGSVGSIRTTDGGANWSTFDAGHCDLTSFDYNPDNPATVIVGSDGGIYRYNRNDDETLNFNEFFSPNAPIQAYEMDAVNAEPAFLVAGTQDNGTMLTLNGSSRSDWETISGCDGGDNVNINPDNPNILYYNSWCGEDNPRFYSNDKGTNVTNISNGLGELYYTPIRINEANPNYVFTVDGSNLYYTTNHGTTWKRATTAGKDFASTERQRAIAVSRSPSGQEVIVYVIFWYSSDDPSDCEKVKIFKGQPGSMTSSDAQFTLGYRPHRVIADRIERQKVYVIGGLSPYRIQMSTNSGQTWLDISGNLPVVRRYDIERGRNSANELYVGTDLGVFKTTDGGTNWYKFQRGLPMVPVMAMSYLNGSHSDTLKIATFGQGFWYRQLGIDDPEFELSEYSFGLNKISTVYNMLSKTYQLIIAGGKGKMLYSDDICETISESVNEETSYYSCQLIPNGFSPAKTAILSGKSGAIARTTNLGKSWTAVNSNATGDIYDMAYYDATCYAASYYGEFLKSTNEGAGWVKTFHDSDFRIKDIFVRAEIFLAGGTAKTNSWHPALKYSSNKGISWIDASLPEPIKSGWGRVNSIIQPAIGTYYAFGEFAPSGSSTFKGFMLKSINNGESWTVVNTNIADRVYSSVFIDKYNGFVCGINGFVAQTSNSGQTWKKLNSGTDNNLNYTLYLDGTLLIAGDNVLIRKYFGITSAEKYEANSESLLEQNSPNPVENETMIKYTLVNSGKVRLELASLNGVKVKTLFTGYQAAGRYEINIDMAGLPAGIYFYSLSTASGYCRRQLVYIP